MKDPLSLVVPDNLYLNYPDAVHYQRGIHNAKVRSFEVDINIPAVNNNGTVEPDYDLIQKIWWTGL
jgi:hypothetical protein